MKYIPYINIDKCLGVRQACLFYFGGGGATNEFFRPKKSIIFLL